jgi:hypothetical protein
MSQIPAKKRQWAYDGAGALLRRDFFHVVARADSMNAFLKQRRRSHASCKHHFRGETFGSVIAVRRREIEC